MRVSGRLLTTAVLLLMWAGSVFAQAQTPKPAPSPSRTPSEELIVQWNDVHNKLIEMAKDFPEDKFDFKVQKDQRTFAENLLHVVGVDYIFLNSISTTKLGPDFGKDPENPLRTTYATRADLVKLLQQVTADGVALVKQIGDAGLAKEYKYAYANRMAHASYSLWSDLEHAGEHYGQLVVYYRANNLVPPDSRH